MLKNVSANWMLTVVEISVGFLIMPFSIRVLGQDQYGTWVLISSLTGYLAMLTLGIPMAAVRFIAKYSTPERQEELDRTIGSCAGLYILIGIGALIVGTALLGVFHYAYDVTPAFRKRADLAFMIVVVNVAAGFIAQLPYGVMGAHRDFVVMNKIRITGQVIRLALVYLLLSLDTSLVWLAVVQVSVMSFEFTVATRTMRLRYPRIRVRFRDFDWDMVRQIFSFSVFVLLLQVAGKIAFSTDALVIGAFLPIETIPFFAVPASLALYMMQFVIGISRVVMPLTTHLETQRSFEQLRAVMLKWSKFTASLCLVSGLFLIVLGPRFLAWWIGPAFEGPAGSVLEILILGNLVFLPVRGVAFPMLMGLGRVGRPTVGFLVAAVLNLALSVVLVRPFGIEGVAIGTAIPNIVYAVYLAVIACRALGVSLRAYVLYAFARPLVGSVPVLGLLLVLRDGLEVQGFGQLFVSGVVTLLVFGASTALFTYRRDPHVDLPQSIRRLMPWRRV